MSEGKFDLSKLSKTEQSYIKLIEAQNLARVQRLQRVQKNNRITAGVLGVSVLGIYAYSIFAVKQEKFLDDFDEPVKVFETKN